MVKCVKYMNEIFYLIKRHCLMDLIVHANKFNSVWNFTEIYLRFMSSTFPCIFFGNAYET